MEQSITQMAQRLSQQHSDSQMTIHPLFPGITLSFLTLKAGQVSLAHDALTHILQINYCKAGRMGWKMENGNTVYLGSGNFSLHTMDVCTQSVITLPNEFYEGLTLYIDLHLLTAAPPELLADSGITGDFLFQKFCSHDQHVSFAATAQSEAIFSGFFDQPHAYRASYWRLKTLELLLLLAQLPVSENAHLTAYQAEQVEIIRNIHDWLTAHIEQHFTIEALAKQFLINPTTLKNVFKAVYGNSIATHTREHRMEKAAALLVETQASISEIARAVGYESQSKFTAAFKEYHLLLPREYRKQYASEASRR